MSLDTTPAPGRCWLLHRWSMWRTYQRTTPGVFVEGALTGQKYLTYEVRQARRCTRCGLTEDVFVRDGKLEVAPPPEPV